MRAESPRAPGVTLRETVASASEPPSAAANPAAPDPAGSSLDDRHIQIRRTLIYLEPSIKAALDQFVFEPNTPATWSRAVSAVTSVLQAAWTRGELPGATPGQAFSVQCSLGSTMTARDVRDGNLAAQVTLPGLQPAPTVLTVQVKLQSGA